MLKLARDKKDFRGILAIAALTKPPEFTPKLHMIVEQQLSEAIDRLKAEFEGEPELYERILQAIVDGPQPKPFDGASMTGTIDLGAGVTDFTNVVTRAAQSS